jgi:hypothetical protein
MVPVIAKTRVLSQPELIRSPPAGRPTAVGNLGPGPPSPGGGGLQDVGAERPTGEWFASRPFSGHQMLVVPCVRWCAQPPTCGHEPRLAD